MLVVEKRRPSPWLITAAASALHASVVHVADLRGAKDTRPHRPFTKHESPRRNQKQHQKQKKRKRELGWLPVLPSSFPPYPDDVVHALREVGAVFAEFGPEPEAQLPVLRAPLLELVGRLHPPARARAEPRETGRVVKARA
jgi:hypothetical protein